MGQGTMTLLNIMIHFCRPLFKPLEQKCSTKLNLETKMEHEGSWALSDATVIGFVGTFRDRSSVSTLVTTVPDTYRGVCQWPHLSSCCNTCICTTSMDSTNRQSNTAPFFFETALSLFAKNTTSSLRSTCQSSQRHKERPSPPHIVPAHLLHSMYYLCPYLSEHT